MKRRLFILGATTWTILAWAAPTLGQSRQPIVIGWLSDDSPESGGQYLGALKDGLTALGWKEGLQVVVEERWANAKLDRVQLGKELAARKPAVIVGASLGSATLAAKAAPGIPIVMVTGGDPVAAGLVASLARPGGMVTGVTAITVDVTEKHLELLRAAVPTLHRVGFLINPKHPNRVGIMEAARRSVARYPVEARFAEAGSALEIEPAISGLIKQGVQALIVTGSVTFLAERRRIVKLALAQRWPVVAWVSEFAEDGALLSYAADRAALYRRAAYYVDKILKGAKPADLPIEQPTKFELVVNLKTAKALGLTIPQPFLMRADRVIE